MKDFDTYIFDLDGTLLYTLDDLTASVNHAMRQCGYAEHTVSEVRMMVGNGIRKLIERAVPEGTGHDDEEKAYEAFMAHYLEHDLDTTCPYPGITAMLDELKRRGKKLAVVSNKYCEATERLCRTFFADSISVAIGESPRIRKKPAPDTVMEAMARLGADKESAVYVGDSVDGGQALGQKNTGVGIWLVMVYLNPVVAIAPCAYVVWQNTLNSWQLWCMEKYGRLKW